MMKKLYSPFLLRTAFVVLLMLAFVRGWGQITEGFEGTTIPAAGWTYNSVTHGTNNPRTGSRCATFNATNDAITSPLISNPNQLSFWYRRSTNTTFWGLSIEVLNSSNVLVATLTPVSSSTDTYQQYTADLSSYSNIKIRITDTRSTGAQERYIDDFSISIPSGKTVTFNSNYGTPTTTTQNSSTTANLTANSFTRIGYSFANWHTTTSGTGGTTYTNGQSYNFLADLTLYAQWSINQYNVSYDLNGGTGTTPTTQTGDYNTNITLAIGSGFTRAGFTFNGWNTAANGSGTPYASGGTYTIPALSQTLYAQWTVVPALTPPTLTAAIGATVDNPFAVTFTDDVAWRGAINEITIGGTTLTAGSVMSAGNITFTPSASVPANLLQQGGTKTFVVKATGYSDATVVQPINAGAPVKIVISTQPAGPTANGGLLFTQPILDLSDQYNNPTGATSATVAATVGAGAWTLGGNTTVSSVGSAMTYSNLTATSAAEVLGATMVFTATGFPPVTSGPFNIPGPVLPVITSSLTKSNIYGTADTYTITASGSPTAYSTGTLPPGFSFSGNVITKSVSVDQGTYNISITATNGGGSDTKTLVWTVTRKPLSVMGITGANKVYDGSTNATVTGTATLSGGIIGSDDVSLAGTPAFVFADANVNTTKPITVTGYTLSGTKAGNYSLAQPTTLTANITAKPLTISAPIIAPKVYDGSNATGAITPGTLSGLEGTQTLNVTATGTYADANAGIGKPATIVYSLANGTNGGLATNYSLANGTGTGDITKAPLIFITSTINISTGTTYTLPGTNISTPSNGTLNYSLTSNGYATLSAGVITAGSTAGLETLTVNQTEGTNHLAGNTTVTVNVSTFNSGDFRTITGTGLLWSTANHWQMFNGSTWNTAGADGIPGSTRTVYIHGSMSTNGSRTANNINIESGGNLIISASSTSSSSTIVKTGGILQLNAALTNSGTFEIQDSGTAIINYAASTNTALWNGVEIFHPNSNFVIKNWTSTASNPLYDGANVSQNSYNGYTASFGNLILDFAANPGRDYDILDSGVSTNLAHGNLIFRNSPTFSGTQRAVRISTTGVINSGIGGNLIIENTYNSADFITLKTSGTITFTVGKGLEINSATFRPLAGGGTSVLNILGNLNIAGGTFNFNSTSGAGSSTVNLQGDLDCSTTGLLFSGNSTTKGVFNFIGNAIQKIDVATTTATSVNENRDINFSIKPNAYVQLANRNFELGTNSKLTVENGGTLDFGFNGSTPLNIVRSGSTSGQSFEAAESSILKITSPEGIIAGNTTPALELYKGNVQIGATSASRVFDVGAAYHYNGKANQATGSGLPSGITGKVIVDLQTTDVLNENLDFTSTGTTTFGTLSGTNGTLDIRKGKVLDIPSNGFRNFNGTTNVNDDGEMDIQKGNIIMSGGRYVISGAGTKPNLTGTYTLTGGTVEFTGTAATKIRTSSPAKQYYNVDVSGTNVETGGKNFVVNQILKAINPVVVTESSLLTIPEVADNVAPYVVNAKKGIQVASRGQILFQNNAQLMQDTSASNSGNIKVLRNQNTPAAQYSFWSSPVKDSNVRYLYDANNQNSSNNAPFVLYYNTTDDKFKNVTSTTAVKGMGYAIKGRVVPNATFIGEPVNDDFIYQNFTGGNTSNLRTGGNGNYNLVGNPYPSYLSLDALYSNNSLNIESSFYFWDFTNNEALAQQGSSYTDNYPTHNYAVYNAPSGTPVGAPNNSGKTANGFVKIGQGFLVRAKAGNSGLQFRNGQRVSSGSTEFFGKDATEKDRYWLKISSPKNLGHSMAVVYLSNAQNIFDEYDTKVVAVAGDDIYSIVDNNKLAINGRNSFVKEDVVNLGVSMYENGNYKIEIDTKEGIFANGQSIYLKDKLTNTITNLTEGSYNYTATAGQSTDRFEIIYKPESVLATDSNVKESLQVYRNGEDFIVKSSQNKIQKVDVYDTNGRLLKSIKGSAEEIKIDASMLPSGMYILNINRNNEVINKKIIK